MSSFAKKVALITGSNSGIGQATSKLLASRGCLLALCGKKTTQQGDGFSSHEELDHTAAICIKEGLSKEQILVIPGDLCQEKDVQNTIKKTIEHFGKLDILVNNAGIFYMASAENTSLEAFDNVMKINARSIFHLTKLAIPHLIKTKGCVVNVSSVSGLRSFPGVAAYSMSKSALDQFTRCSALEMAEKQVRVNSVNPGVIETGIHLRAGMQKEHYDEYMEHCKETHALGRVGQSHEVASAIVFLASDEASFITGVTLSVDGGKHIMCPR